MSAIGEFELITQYFEYLSQDSTNQQNKVVTGIGDDCAITELPAHHQLAITTDTMVGGSHFLLNISPQRLAHKIVATNLSDLAAMGAVPAWISLALTLPNSNTDWLQQFSQGLQQILQRYQASLIGGDTTKGNLSLTITAQGFIPKGMALCRSGAKVGDLIYVSGSLGDSAAGLQLILNAQSSADNIPQNAVEQYLFERHLCPTPRVELGLALCGIVNSAVDISDGLLADLGHILQRSQCSAELELSAVPLSPQLLQFTDSKQALQWALTGGEDYELCFTVPAEKREEIEQIAEQLELTCTCIGRILPVSEQRYQFLQNGKSVDFSVALAGHDHFKENK